MLEPLEPVECLCSALELPVRATQVLLKLALVFQLLVVVDLSLLVLVVGTVVLVVL
jgi:hypothetical protein